MKIAIVGGNGQVASEVSLLLASQPGVTVRPIVRTKGGSAFLRYNGLRVRHGSIANPAEAPSLLEGANVVANFALAIGTPAVTRTQNAQLVEAVFEHAPAGATVVFFSTLAINGEVDASGERRRSVYSDVKLSNEQLVARLARRAGKKSYVLRLGHVAGHYQPISRLIRDEMRSAPICIPDPERSSNVVHTATIADALLAIGSGRAGAEGTYDLVNTPPWTWRKVYEWEAALSGLTPQFRPLNQPQAGRTSTGLLRRAFGLSTRLASRERLSRLAMVLPGDFNEKLRAEHRVRMARHEMAQLRPSLHITNTAALWPALPVRPLEGLTATEALLRNYDGVLDREPEARWPLIAAD